MFRSHQKVENNDEQGLQTGEQTTPVPPDGSGWTPHPSERRDFYHRIRVFAPEMATWRQQLIRLVQDDRHRCPQVAQDREQLLSQVDQGISFLREIARILAVLHGSPRLGN
jgi:hypothetical protein